MSIRNVYIDDNIYDYILNNSLRDLPILEKLREETRKMPEGRMQISSDQGQFMALLVRLMGAKKIVEVGTFTGYSTLVMALSLPENGQIVACDISEEYTKVARRFWQEAGISDKIKLRLGLAEETLADVLSNDGAGMFDMAFIDADKENYMVYYEKCLELLRPGGLILVDNVLWSGKPANPDEIDNDTVAIREFNIAIHKDERVDLSLLPVGDGLTLARKH